jgi:hypothetical protein
MRTLTANVTAATARQVTAPHYLLALQFSTPLYLSSRESLVWNGLSWVSGDFRIRRLSPIRGGMSAEVTLSNHDNAYSAIVLGEEVRGKKAQIWALYGDPPYAQDDPVALFSGEIDAVPEIADQVSLKLISKTAGAVRLPDIPLSLFLGEDMPPDGTVIEWTGGKVTLEARNG